AAIVLLQPVLILLAEPLSPGVRLQSLLGSATALVNVVIIAIINRAYARQGRPPLAAMRFMTWVLTSVWLGLAFFDAILAELGADGVRVADRVAAGPALVLAAGGLMVAAVVAPAPRRRAAAARPPGASLPVA